MQTVHRYADFFAERDREARAEANRRNHSESAESGGRPTNWRDPEHTHYSVLGLPRPRVGAPPGQGSDVTEIKKRYRELALKYHPDKCDLPDAAERITEINEAYRVLSDDALRRDYDNQTFPYG